jgi:AcrR family transcriptional regulator
MAARGGETKSQILEAATQEFSEKGFHGARVDTIADRAGINKQRIYAYFESKEKLFIEVLKGCFELINSEESFFTELTDADIPFLNEIILHRYMSFHKRVPQFWRLIAWENLSGGEHMECLRGIRNKTFTHLRGLYQKGQEMGIFRADVSFETHLYVLTSLSFFYYANQHTMSKTLDLDLLDTKVEERIISESLRIISAPELPDRP